MFPVSTRQELIDAVRNAQRQHTECVEAASALSLKIQELEIAQKQRNTYIEIVAREAPAKAAALALGEEPPEDDRPAVDLTDHTLAITGLKARKVEALGQAQLFHDVHRRSLIALVQHDATDYQVSYAKALDTAMVELARLHNFDRTLAAVGLKEAFGPSAYSMVDCRLPVDLGYMRRKHPHTKSPVVHSVLVKTALDEFLPSKPDEYQQRLADLGISAKL